MADFSITGIQQVGVGTVNFRKSWNWFIEMFGMDIKILSSMLGHSNVRITYDLYVHPDISEDQKTIELMDRIFSDNS